MRRAEQKRRAAFMRKRSASELQAINPKYLSSVTGEGVLVVAAETLEIKVITQQVLRWLFKGQGMMSSLSQEMREGLLSRLLKAFYTQVASEPASLADKVAALARLPEAPLTAFLAVEGDAGAAAEPIQLGDIKLNDPQARYLQVSLEFVTLSAQAERDLVFTFKDLRASKQGDLNAAMLRQDIDLFRGSFLDELGPEPQVVPQDYVGLRFRELQDYISLKAGKAEVRATTIDIPEFVTEIKERVMRDVEVKIAKNSTVNRFKFRTDPVLAKSIVRNVQSALLKYIQGGAKITLSVGVEQADTFTGRQSSSLCLKWLVSGGESMNEIEQLLKPRGTSRLNARNWNVKYYQKVIQKLDGSLSVQATDDVIIIVTRLPELGTQPATLQPLNFYDVDQALSLSEDPADLSVTDLDNRSILTSFRKQNQLQQNSSGNIVKLLG